MLNINDTNGDSKILEEYQKKLLEEFDDTLIGAEFGVAYGGGIEQICRVWKDRGIVYGYDTFTTHPRHLVEDQISLEAGVMEGWYANHGTEDLDIDVISKNLLESGYNNFILEKGLVTKDTIIKAEKLHYVLLDLDILQSMKDAFDLVKNKIVIGGYLCLHDVIPNLHMPRLNHWWFEEADHKEFLLKNFGKHLVVYKKLR